MALVACLADTPALVSQISQQVEELGHQVQVHCASYLDRTIRQGLRTLKPDIILLELTRALDNPHLYFFMRTDSLLRDVPVILVAHGHNLSERAAVLGADGFLNSPFDLDQLADFLPEEVSELRAAMVAA